MTLGTKIQSIFTGYRKSFHFTWVLCALFVLQGCGGEVSSSGESASIPETLVVNTRYQVMPTGLRQTLSVSFINSNGVKEDVTEQSKLQVNSPALTLEGNVVTAQAEGSAVVTVSYEGMQASSEINVVEGSLLELYIEPESGSGYKLVMPRRFRTQYEAYALYLIGSTKSYYEVTEFTKWDSSEGPQVDKNGLVTGFSLATQATITGLYTEPNNGPAVENTSLIDVVDFGKYTKFTISTRRKDDPFVVGSSVPLKAMVWFIDHQGFSRSWDVTRDAVWTADPNILEFDDNGVARVISEGTTAISATFLGNYVSANSLNVQTMSTALEEVQVTVEDEDEYFWTGERASLKATGVYSSGITKDLTDEITWLYSGSAVSIDSATSKVTAMQGATPTKLTAKHYSTTKQGELEISSTDAAISNLATRTPKGGNHRVPVELRAIATVDDIDDVDVSELAVWSFTDKAAEEYGVISNIRDRNGGYYVDNLTAPAYPLTVEVSASIGGQSSNNASFDMTNYSTSFRTTSGGSHVMPGGQRQVNFYIKVCPYGEILLNNYTDWKVVEVNCSPCEAPEPGVQFHPDSSVSAFGVGSWQSTPWFFGNDIISTATHHVHPLNENTRLEVETNLLSKDDILPKQYDLQMKAVAIIDFPETAEELPDNALNVTDSAKWQLVNDSGQPIDVPGVTLSDSGVVTATSSVEDGTQFNVQATVENEGGRGLVAQNKLTVQTLKLQEFTLTSSAEEMVPGETVPLETTVILEGDTTLKTRKVSWQVEPSNSGNISFDVDNGWTFSAYSDAPAGPVTLSATIPDVDNPGSVTSELTLQILEPESTEFVE